MAKFGYTIVYVSSVEKSLSFYQTLFGFEIKFLHESKLYGELNTGETTLSFADFSMLEVNFEKKTTSHPENYQVEIAFIVEDVLAVFNQAIVLGATALAEPSQKPWGQTVAYIRDLDSTLIELCTAIEG